MAIERDEFGRFKEGSVPNPNGRPKKGQTITDAVREMLEEVKIIRDKDGKEKEIIPKKVFAERLIKMALDGDMQALKLIWNYLDGMPLQRNLNMQTDVDELSPEEKKEIWKTLKQELGLQQ